MIKLEKNQIDKESDPEISIWLDYLIEPSLFKTFVDHCNKILASRNNEDAILDIIKSITKETENIWSNMKLDAPSFDCHKGCSWCCHQSVSVTWPELMLIALSIRENLDVNQIVDLKKRSERKSEGILEKFNKDSVSSFHKIPCMFLENGICSIHSARPLQCRGGFSEDKSYCKSLLEDTEVTQNAVSSGELKGKFLIIPKLIYNTAQVALTHIMQNIGMKGKTYELTVAISILISKIQNGELDAVTEKDLDLALLPKNFNI